MDTQRSLVSLQDLKPVIRWWNVSNLWPEVGCSMSDRVSCRPRAQTEIRADQTWQQAGGRARAGSGLLHLFVSKPSGNRCREEWTQSGGRWKTRKLPADSRRRDDVIRNTMLFCSDPEHRHSAGSLTYCLLFHVYKTVLLFITLLF